MPYAINVGDVIEYTVDMRYVGSRMLNVYHYRYKVGSSTISDGRAALFTYLTDQATDVTGIFDCTRLAVTSLLRFVSHRAQIIYPTRKPSVDYALGMDGGRDIGGLPSGVAACVALRQGEAGRSLNGRKEIPGLLVDDLVADLWEPTAVSLLNQIGSAAILDRPISGPTQLMEPIIFRRASPIFSQVNDGYAVRPQARYLTRRTLGRGE